MSPSSRSVGDGGLGGLVSEVRIIVPAGVQVKRTSAMMQKGDQFEYSLELEMLGCKLRLNNGLGNFPLALDDMVEREGLYTLCLGLV